MQCIVRVSANGWHDSLHYTNCLYTPFTSRLEQFFLGCTRLCLILKQCMSPYLLSCCHFHFSTWNARFKGRHHHSDKSLAHIQVFGSMIRAQLWQLHKSTEMKGGQRDCFIVVSSIQGQAGLEPTNHGFMPGNTLAILRDQAGEGQFQFLAKYLANQEHRPAGFLLPLCNWGQIRQKTRLWALLDKQEIHLNYH